MDARAPSKAAVVDRTGGALHEDKAEKAIRAAFLEIQSEAMRRQGDRQEGAYIELAGDTLRLLGRWKRLRAA